MPKIVKQMGLTPAERYLGDLATSCCLPLWSYPAVYRDQRSGGGRTEGKEVCDLLVVFDEHILLFSDKHCEFKYSGKLEVDWARWYRRSVLHSARQVWGAGRWIRSHPDRLFIDRDCTQRFPIPMPPDPVFHRIVVAHGISEVVRAKLGSSPTLMLRIDPEAEVLNVPPPFSVGNLDPSRGFVHVLDDASLELVLKTRDTLSDLVHYLSAKEALLHSRRVIAPGEEELLGVYMQNVDGDGNHFFDFPPDGALELDGGFWERFEASRQRAAQLEADKTSYLWDYLIKKTSYHVLDDTQYHSSPGGQSDGEVVLRHMARENRFSRRILSESFLEVMKRSKADERSLRMVQPVGREQICYVFLLLPWYESLSERDYRKFRRDYLEICCRVAKLEFPDANDILGIATEAGHPDGRSEDLLRLDVREWTDEMAATARELQEEFDILVSKNLSESHFDEFPM